MVDVSLLLPSELELERLVRVSQVAEQLGALGVWYPDSRFLRDPFVSLAVLAGATERLQLGTAVTDPFLRHPALLAMAFASLAELAPDRIRAGIGAGASGLRQLKIERPSPLAGVRTALEALRKLLGGETWEHDGHPFPSAGVALEFPANHVSLFLGTRSPKMLALAGQVADGVILGHLASPTSVERALSEVRGGERGRDVRIVCRLQVIVGGTLEARRVRARQVAAWVLRQHVRGLGWLRELGMVIPEYLVAALGAVKSPRDVAGVADLVPEATAQALTVTLAAPEELTDRLNALPTVDEVMLRVDSVKGEPYERLPDLLKAAQI